MFDINKLTNEVICKLLPLFHKGITHKNKTGFFSKIIEISSCFLFTAIFGIPFWATSFVATCLIYQNIEYLGAK